MDRRLRTTFVTVGACAALLTLGGAFAFGSRGAVSVALGGLVALSNLFVFARIVASVAVPMAAPPRHAQLLWTVLALPKTMLLFGGVWFLVTRHLVDPIHLVVGYGCLPIGIAIGAVVSDKTGSRDDTPQAP
jgi:hypothetical protein